MSKRKVELCKVNEMLKRIERTHTPNKIYTQKVYIDARTACKLEIISYLEARSKSEISRKAIQLYIKSYESKKGNIINKMRYK